MDTCHLTAGEQSTPIERAIAATVDYFKNTDSFNGAKTLYSLYKFDFGVSLSTEDEELIDILTGHGIPTFVVRSEHANIMATQNQLQRPMVTIETITIMPRCPEEEMILHVILSTSGRHIYVADTSLTYEPGEVKIIKATEM